MLLYINIRIKKEEKKERVCLHIQIYLYVALACMQFLKGKRHKL